MSLLEHAAETPDRPAVIEAETGAAMSFRELNARSMRLARVLRRHLDEGERVAQLMDNGPNYFVGAWAARRSALRFVPINWHLGVDEAAYIVANSDSKALIASPRLGELVQQVADRCADLQLLLSEGEAFGAFRPMSEAIEAEPTQPLEPEMEGNAMSYSSGTTGHPKGILRPLPNAPFGSPHAMEITLRERWGWTRDTVFYSASPLYHAAPLGWTMGAQALGSTVVSANRFDAEAALRHIQDYRVSHTQMVPTHFVRMLKLPEHVRRRYDLSSLQRVIHVAAPCPVEVKAQMLEWLGPIVWEYYAQSEGAGMTIVSPQEWLAHRGTVGRSVTGALHILDDDGHELPPGETGHVLFENAQPAFAYHKDEAKTAAYFDPRGWRRPGDMGFVDEDGYLFLVDRANHMIISGGVNIYPQEIESILALHPAINDVAVIGAPDPDFGEVVKAVVEPAAGVTPDQALADEIIAFCRSRLAGYKCPKSVDFTDALPRLPTGKLLKRELRKRYWGETQRLV